MATNVSKDKEYARSMSDFRGIDATSEASTVSHRRFSFIQNMYKDYKSGQGVAIETFPGTRQTHSMSGMRIYGLHPYKTNNTTYIIVHNGVYLSYFDAKRRDKSNKFSFANITMKEAKSSSFVYNNRLYIIDGEHYIVVYGKEDESTKDFALTAELVDESNLYIPTTFSSGEQYEQRNMLTNKFKERSYVEKLYYNDKLAPSSSTDARFAYYADEVIDDKTTVSADMAVVCPSIWHVPQGGTCYCNSKNHDNLNTRNQFMETNVEISNAYKYVKIDFNKVLLEWSKCVNRSDYIITCYKKSYNNYYYESVTYSVTNPHDDGNKDALISIEELNARRENDDSVGVIGENVPIPKYNYEKVQESALDETSDLARRKFVTSVTMGNSVEYIFGNLSGCTKLSSIILSDNIKTLEDNFFSGTAITTAYLPARLTSLGQNAFKGCDSLKTIYASSKKIVEVKPESASVMLLDGDGSFDTGDYESGGSNDTATTMTSMYEMLTNNKDYYGINNDVTIKSYESEFMEGIPHDATTEEEEKNRVYIKTPCEKITYVKVKGAEVSELTSVGENEKVALYVPVYKYIEDKRHIIAVDFYNTLCDEFAKDTNGNNTKDPGYTEINDIVEIHGEAFPSVFTTSEEAAEESKDALSAHKDYEKSAIEAVKNCTVCCTFDDRIFFTGNPELPNTVFYTHRDLTGHINPTYVGVLNWFDDGMGNTPNVAMMSNASTLMVLKGNTMQDGSIYYHVGADGGNDITPRIYPSTEGLAGLGCVGLAVNFRDDCCFLSKQGLEAVSKQAVNLERTIAHRSTNIDGLLLRCDLANARAAEWEGYLCILIDGQMFLADSRQMFEGIGGAIEYEWYYVNPVGGYDGDNEKYILADWMPDGLRAMLDALKAKAEANNEDRSKYDFLLDLSGNRSLSDNDMVYNQPIYYGYTTSNSTYELYKVKGGTETKVSQNSISSDDADSVIVKLTNIAEGENLSDLHVYVTHYVSLSTTIAQRSDLIKFDEKGIAKIEFESSEDVTGDTITIEEIRIAPFGDTKYSVNYILRDGEKYLVESGDEKENGTLDKACEICAVEDLLLFGTENGKILCLNTDKRGSDENEPDKSRIPTKWYNNSKHAYDAVAVFAMENAGVPHFTKTTVKRGTVLRLKSFPASSFEVYATTDNKPTTLLAKMSNSITTFDEMDFANLGLLTNDSGILAIKEKTKKWVEKQYMIIGKEYNQPWGIYSLTYRYTIQGEVKNK